MKNPFTTHPSQTSVPEGFWTHFYRAFVGGCILISAGLASIIHAFFPWWLAFYTAEVIIRLYWTVLHVSGRHQDLINKWSPQIISKQKKK